MKKLTTLLFAVTILAFSFALTGCRNGGTFMAKAYSSQGKSVTSISIDAYDREIEVRASEDNELHIDYFESEKEYYKISVSADNVLTMTLLNNKIWTDFIGMQPKIENRKITLLIPNSLLSSLTIATTNEPIKLSQISVIDTISLSSNGGNIEFEKIDVRKELTLTAKNGNIQGTIIGSYDAFSIECKIKKGKCNLPLAKTDGEKALKANNNNGDIKIDFNNA